MNSRYVSHVSYLLWFQRKMGTLLSRLVIVDNFNFW